MSDVVSRGSLVSRSSLADRTMIVTGGTRGIGLEIGRRLARGGANVVLTGRGAGQIAAAVAELESLSQSRTSDGAQAIVGLEMDVRDAEQVQSVALATMERFGRIDGLVANSGIAGPSARAWDVEPGAWDETLRVNLTGPYLCARAVLPSMIEQHGGSIVLIGSITGKRPLLERSAYAASKLGLVGFCRTLSLDAGGYGVRANVVSPGFVAGERLDLVIEAQARAQSCDVDDVRSQFMAQSPLARLVTPGDVAELVAFLLDDASAAITGADINVAAGSVMY